MIEKITYRDGKRVIEVRSKAGGKLLFIKTKRGYEIMCRKTHKICVVSYDHMFLDCLKSFMPLSSYAEVLVKAEEIRQTLIL